MYECSEARMQDKISTMSKFGDAGHGGIPFLRKRCRQEVNLSDGWRPLVPRLRQMMWPVCMPH